MVTPYLPEIFTEKETGRFRVRKAKFTKKLVLQIEIKKSTRAPHNFERVIREEMFWRDATVHDFLLGGSANLVLEKSGSLENE